MINREFVQFHPPLSIIPTAPFSHYRSRGGAGGRLVHANGKPFMHTYDPEWKDLAPRDVVAKGIYHEMLDKDVPNVCCLVATGLFLPLSRGGDTPPIGVS